MNEPSNEDDTFKNLCFRCDTPLYWAIKRRAHEERKTVQALMNEKTRAWMGGWQSESHVDALDRELRLREDIEREVRAEIAKEKNL